MDDQSVDQAGEQSVDPSTTPALRRRPLADILFWVYTTAIVIVFSSGLIDHWPRWAWNGAVVIGGLLALWSLVIAWKDLSRLRQGRPVRFSLRGMLLLVPVVSVVVWLFIQLDWIEKREKWRRHHP